jgi:hypothetical protein
MNMDKKSIWSVGKLIVILMTTDLSACSSSPQQSTETIAKPACGKSFLIILKRQFSSE